MREPHSTAGKSAVRFLASIIATAGISACSLPAEYVSHRPLTLPSIPEFQPLGQTVAGGDHPADTTLPSPASTQPTSPATRHDSPAPTTHPAIPSLLANGNTLLLSRCTKHALAENLDIKFSTTQLTGANAAVDVAKAAFDPSIEIAGVHFPDGGGTTDGFATVKKRFVTGTEIAVEAGTLFYDRGDRTDGTRTDSAEFELNVRQPLLRGLSPKVNRAPIEIARIEGASADAARQAEIFEVLRASESAYWTAAYARGLLAAQATSYRRTKDLYDAVEKKQQAGEASKIDLLEAKAAVSSAHDSLVRAKKRYLDVLGLLWSLLGIEQYETPFSISFQKLRTTSRTAAPNPETHYRLALANSPTVAILGNEVERRSLRRMVAGNQLLPELDLEFTYGSNDPFSIDSSDPGGSSVGGNWSTLLRLSIPWTFRAERANVKIAQAELLGSRLKQQQGLRDLRRLCHETCREIQSGHEQLNAASTALDVNRAKWEEQRSLHREGFATARDLTEAEAELRLAEARELEARLRIVLAETALARLNGTIANRNGLTL